MRFVISSAIEDFYLQKLLLFCLPNWDFISIAIIPCALINWNFTAWNSYPFHHLLIDLMIYVYQYELMDMYFILWVIIHHYHYYFVEGIFSHLATGSYSDILKCLKNFWTLSYFLAHKLWQDYLNPGKDKISNWKKTILKFRSEFKKHVEYGQMTQNLWNWNSRRRTQKMEWKKYLKQ